MELPNGLEADEFFLEIKKAHDVLTHDLRRSFYDRFGDMQQGECGKVLGVEFRVRVSGIHACWGKVPVCCLAVGDLDDRTAIIAACLSLAVHLLCFSTGFLVSYFKHVVFARQVAAVKKLSLSLRCRLSPSRCAAAAAGDSSGCGEAVVFRFLWFTT